jgi:hypothetical protein
MEADSTGYGYAEGGSRVKSINYWLSQILTTGFIVEGVGILLYSFGFGKDSLRQ